jgi:pimeloyl-ACP methyl ester carboxylesterase
MSAALPGFGLEELLDFREEGQGLPHLVFHMQPETPKLLEGQEREYVEGFLGGDPEDEATGEYTRAYSRPGRLEAGLQQYQTLYQDAEDNRAKAEPKLAMPVLALGGGSPEMPLGSMEQVAEDVTGDAVPDAGHYLHEERPEETAEKLLEFFER